MGVFIITGGDEGIGCADLAKSPVGRPARFRLFAAVRTLLSGSNPTYFNHKNKTPRLGVFNFCGGDEGIRTLDTVAGILHFQCSALDQLCDVSGFFDYSADISAVSSVCDAVSASATNEFSNSASISRNNGSSVAPTSNESSPSATDGASLYDWINS